MQVSNTVNTCQLLSAEVWNIANSKIRTKAVNKTLKTFINESKSVKIHETSRNYMEMDVFHGRRPISRKMSRPWNHELGWSLTSSNIFVPSTHSVCESPSQVPAVCGPRELTVVFCHQGLRHSSSSHNGQLLEMCGLWILKFWVRISSMSVDIRSNIFRFD